MSEPPPISDSSETRPAPQPGRSLGLRWSLALLPLVLLALLIWVFQRVDPTGGFRDAFPPIEELTIERITFPDDGRMDVHVINGGPEPVTVAQVQVDEAYWQFDMDTDATIPRLGRSTISLRYPWVEGEPHEIVLVSSTGLTFPFTVEVATRTPEPNAHYMRTFALLGLYAGVIPVLLGLLWYPFLRRVSRRWIHFFLSLTTGLLLFLAIDALEEAFETGALMPEGFHGAALIVIAALGAVIGLRLISAVSQRFGTGGTALGIAYMVAVGIGLHNLGEGLAIGAAYSLGAISLGSFLVIGFALHNTTEGLAIVAPLASERPPIWHLLIMGAIAGIPTILGAWIGGFSYSPIAATIFLSIGAGAIVQVIIEIGKLVKRQEPEGLFAPLNAAGLGLGLLLMYGTSLMVVA